MKELIERLSAIKTDLIQLKSEHKQLKEKEKIQGKEIQKLKKLLDIQNNSIRKLEQKLKIKRIADEISDSGIDGENEIKSNKDLKFKISEMIREVDKVISLLHQ